MSFKLKIIWHLLHIKCSKWLFEIGFESVKKRRIRSIHRRLKNSPFYSSIEANMKSYPIINKAIFMDNFNTINTCGIQLNEALIVASNAEKSRDFSPMIGGVTVGLSTGTSGNRGIFLANENERAIWVAAILDRVLGFTFRKRKVAFFLRANSNIYQSTQSKILQFHFFDLYENLQKQIDRLNKLQPTIVVAQPSMLMLLAEAKISGQLLISPSKIISVAEVLTLEDKSHLEAVFSNQIHQVYQCTEGFLAATCKHGTLHFNEDFLIIEKKYINEKRTKFHPIVTDLFRSSQPIIRYELNDIITEKKDCACGSKFLAIEQIEGRSDDILIFTNNKGEKVHLFPDIFRRTLVLVDHYITDYCVIQSNSNELKLYVKSEGNHSYENAVSELIKLFDSYDISKINIVRIYESTHEIGFKKRRIKNESRATN